MSVGFLLIIELLVVVFFYYFGIRKVVFVFLYVFLLDISNEVMIYVVGCSMSV